jgi:hypothetical protein
MGSVLIKGDSKLKRASEFSQYVRMLALESRMDVWQTGKLDKQPTAVSRRRSKDLQTSERAVPAGKGPPKYAAAMFLTCRMPGAGVPIGRALGRVYARPCSALGAPTLSWRLAAPQRALSFHTRPTMEKVRARPSLRVCAALHVVWLCACAAGGGRCRARRERSHLQPGRGRD